MGLVIPEWWSPSLYTIASTQTESRIARLFLLLSTFTVTEKTRYEEPVADTMSVTTSDSSRVDLDLPAQREYTEQEDAALDKALVKAIERAEDADNAYLAQTLRNELKSHYYECQLEQ